MQHTANVAIEVANHGGIHTQCVIFNVRQCCVVFFGGLQWRVRRGVGQVKEEGLIAIGLNGFFGFVSEVIGDETLGLEKFAVVKAHAKTARSPLESVNDVKVLF